MPAQLSLTAPGSEVFEFGTTFNLQSVESFNKAITRLVFLALMGGGGGGRILVLKTNRVCEIRQTLYPVEKKKCREVAVLSLGRAADLQCCTCKKTNQMETRH